MNKKYTIWFFIAVILSVLVGLNTDVFAQLTITSNNALVTNRAVVSGGNITSSSNGVGVRIKPIVGGYWRAEADIGTGTALGTYSNVSWLTNLGNSTFNFQLGVTNFTRANNDGGLWQYWIYTNTAASTPYLTGYSNHRVTTTNFPIAMGQSKRIVFKVTVAGGSSDGIQRWSLIARTPDVKSNDVAYLGDNGNRYGGPVNAGWADGGAVDALVWYGTGASGAPDTEYTWQVACQQPIVNITKTISSIQTIASAGLDNMAIPGATIFFHIRVTNTGSGSATTIKVRDMIDTVHLQYAGGLSVSTQAGINWRTNVLASSIIWSNNSTTNFGGTGNSGKATFEFRAIIR
ncbi:MAG: hypothetical protein PHF84_00835 [bacterium]|nr:hypothetical protein [bacterium]